MNHERSPLETSTGLMAWIRLLSLFVSNLLHYLALILNILIVTDSFSFTLNVRLKSWSRMLLLLHE